MDNSNTHQQAANDSVNQGIPPGVNTQINQKSSSPADEKKKRIVIALVIFIVILGAVMYMISANHASQQMQQAESFKTKAEDAFQRAKYSDAERIAIDGLHTVPKNKDLLRIALNAIGAEGNQAGKEKEAFAKAKPFMDEILKDYPNDSDALNAVGYMYEIDGQYKTALEYYKKALAANPQDADTLFHLGHVNEFLGNEKEAFADYDKAYQIDPNNPSVLLALGRKQVSTGNFRDSLGYYKKVADMPGVNLGLKAEALTGESYVKQSDIMTLLDSRDLAKQAAETDPGYSPALAEYGYDLGILGHDVEGFDFLNKAIAANPRIAGNYWMRGNINLDMKRYHSAITDLKQGLALMDSDNTLIGSDNKKRLKAQMLYDLANTYVQSNTGKTLDIISWFQQSFQLDPHLRLLFVQRYHNKVFKNFDDNPTFQQFAQAT